MVAFRTTVQPSVLRWARESVRLSEEEAARKLSIRVETLRDWEEGIGSPTFNQLQNMAERYKRPVAVLYLQEPPERFDALKEFRRTLESSGIDLPYELVVALDRVRMQQDVMKEIYELDDEPFPSFQLALNVTQDRELIASEIRDWLRFPVAQQLKWVKESSLVPRLSVVIESRGILVTQVQRIPVSTMRGCALSDHPFPAIVVNGADSPAAKVFTLIHELVHILLRVGGDNTVVPVTRVAPQMDSTVERFCNSVAAAVLMPMGHLLANEGVMPRTRDSNWTIGYLDQIASIYGVSAQAVLLRLIVLERASWDDYVRLRSHFAVRSAQKIKQSANDAPQIYYPLKIRDLGRRYIADVVAAFNRRDISLSDAADYLDMKINNIPVLVRRMSGQRT